jgi:branched-chain amino acid transport system ATP-binding protein
VLDNLALAVQARSGSSFSFWKPVTQEAALFDQARAIADEIGLSRQIDSTAGSLSHGEQRALEVGLALATRPKLVLLDEPMAGMGPEESKRMIALIERIRASVTVLLVEHDMDAVFQLADRISVLVDGRIIATDVPGKIRANPEVRRAYLGDEMQGDEVAA